MTERYKGFTVVLEENIRSDDAKNTINAIRQIKGVIEVAPVIRNGINDYIADQRARRELIDKIYGVLK